MSRIKSKFIVDKSVQSDPLKLIQWDEEGDLAYVPVEEDDWLVVPTGALQAIDELASRATALQNRLANVQTHTGNFNASPFKIHLVSGEALVKLPAPVLNHTVTIKKTGEDLLTLEPHGAEQIEGSASNYLLTSTRQSVTLVSDGTDWFII
jgi:hypothetical protein